MPCWSVSIRIWNRPKMFRSFCWRRHAGPNVCIADLARGHGFSFVREEGARRSTSKADACNGFLDHGNYIAYGYAAVALCGLGISFAMPILHGKTRRGALVFDLADVVKDGYVMPLAFECAKEGETQKDFRQRLIEHCQEEDVLDFLFDFMKKPVCKKHMI